MFHINLAISQVYVYINLNNIKKKIKIDSKLINLSY